LYVNLMTINLQADVLKTIYYRLGLSKEDSLRN